jgi:hypothetical protein
MDNLNTHREKSLIDSFGVERGHAVWSRFTVHYTPKHGSWLNPAELEASLWSRQCLGRQHWRPWLNAETHSQLESIGKPHQDQDRLALLQLLMYVASSVMTKSLPTGRALV